MHTELRVLQPVAQKCVHTHSDLRRVPKNFQFSSSLLTVYTKGTQIFHKCRSQLKIRSASWVTRTKFRTQEPQFSHHHTKFSRPGHLVSCICVPLVSALRVGQACDVISHSLIAASWKRSRYVVSLLLFSESQLRQPASPSEPCVSGCSFLPDFRN